MKALPTNQAAVQPQSTDLEAAVIGAMLLDSSVMVLVDSILTPSDFYEPSNSLIFEAAQKLYEAQKPIDLLTVTEQLKRMGKLEEIGGAYRMVEITHTVGSTANVEYHARLVKELAIKRQIILLGQFAIKSAFDDGCDAFEVLDEFNLGMLQLSDGFTRSRERDLDAVMLDILKAKNSVTAPLFGVRKLDAVLNGWEPGDVVCIGGRPSRGKSVLGNMVLLNALKRKEAVYYWSGEMTAEKTTRRLLSSISGVPSYMLKKGLNALNDHEANRLDAAIRLVGAAYRDGLLIIADGKMSSLDFRSRCISLARKGFKLFVADRLELFTDHDSGANEIGSKSKITQRMRVLSPEVGGCVVFMSQLRKEVDNRPGGLPIDGDLIGRTADDCTKVIMISRPEMNGVKDEEQAGSMQGKCIIQVTKNTDGNTGAEIFDFIGETSEIRDGDTPAFAAMDKDDFEEINFDIF